MNQELITVIVPIYNVIDYIDDCIESLIKQTYENLEIILVDDGTPDGCSYVADYYCMMDRRIKAIHKVNGGASSARNYGLELVSGEYIVFQDSDDLYNTNAISDFLMCMKRYNPDIIQGTGRLLDGNVDIECCNQEPCSVMVSSSHFLEMLYNRKSNNKARISVQNKLYKRKLFYDTRFYEGIIYEDEEFIPRIVDKAEKVCILDNNGYYYRIVLGSVMHSAFSEKNFDVITAKSNVIDYFRGNNKNSLPKEYYTTYLFDLFSLIYSTRKSEISNKKEHISRVYKEIRSVLGGGVLCSPLFG